MLLLVLCLGLTPPVCAQAQESSVSIPFGAEISAELAEKLVYAEAWLQGTQQLAEQLRNRQAFRLAELDWLDQLALAAMQNAVSLKLFNTKLLLDEQGVAYGAGEGEAIAWISLLELDESVFSRSLAQLEQRALYAEALVRIWDLTGEARQTAQAAAEQRNAMRILERQSPLSSSARAPIMYGNPNHSEQLEQIALRLNACFAYLDLLGQGPAWLGSSAAEQIIDLALQADPDFLPYLIAKAQLMLRQDRTVAAMRLLTARTLPELTWSMDEYLHDTLAQARSIFRVRQEIQVRFLQVRSLALLGSAEPEQALADLDQALDLRPDQPVLWLSRGAVRQVMQDFELMCLDYYQACRLGVCLGLSTAQDTGHCREQQ